MTSVAPVVLAPTWDSGALLAKAQRYAEQMLEYPHDDWRFAFWSTLTIELLVRSALARVSPVLLADQTSWNNVYYALGHTPTAQKFSPKSIAISEAITRLGEILPNFDKDLEKFCIIHTGNRNAELHSGDTPFDGVKPSTWLPSFYRACDVIMGSLSGKLEDLIGQDEATAAKKLIAASSDDAAKAVNGVIKAHQTVWAGKTEVQRQKLTSQAAVWATRQDGHVIECPVCKASGLLMGDAIAPPKKTIDEDLITETQIFLPSKFECVACGMKIPSLSQLRACGLGETYKQTSTYDASDYYATEDENPGYEDDNNE